MAATVGDIGLGEAFVVDFSGLNNTIQRQSQQIAAQYQRRQQQRAKENEELGDLVAKISPNGLRREDIDDYSKRYQSIKDKYVRAIGLENEADRRRARAEVQQDLNELNTFVGNSKTIVQYCSYKQGNVL
jgi:Skp family chaperone for outer membrane proteins